MNATPEAAHSGKLHVAVIAYTEYESDPRVRGETEAVRAAGHSIDVISLRGKRKEAQSAGDAQPRIWQVPLESRRGGRSRYLFQYLMFFMMSTVRLLVIHLRHRIDVVHVHSLPDFQVFCALPLKLRRTAVILDLHEAFPEIIEARFPTRGRSCLVRLAQLAEAASAQFADHIIVANDGIRGAIVSRGTEPVKLTTIYNVTTVPELESERDIREALSLPEGRLIVHAGGINPERDLDTLIRSLTIVPSDLGISLVLAGDGDPEYISSLHKLARDLDIQARVRFVQKLPRTRSLSLMAISEVGVVTARSNPLTELAWPTRIGEFAHLGKPLLVPQLRFILRTLGASALYYSPGDATDLGRQITTIISQAERSESLIRGALEICKALEGDSISERIIEVYRVGANHARARKVRNDRAQSPSTS